MDHQHFDCIMILSIKESTMLVSRFKDRETEWVGFTYAFISRIANHRKICLPKFLHLGDLFRTPFSFVLFLPCFRVRTNRNRLFPGTVGQNIYVAEDPKNVVISMMNYSIYLITHLPSDIASTFPRVPPFHLCTLKQFCQKITVLISKWTT